MTPTQLIDKLNNKPPYLSRDLSMGSHAVFLTGRIHYGTTFPFWRNCLDTAGNLKVLKNVHYQKYTGTQWLEMGLPENPDIENPK